MKYAVFGVNSSVSAFKPKLQKGYCEGHAFRANNPPTGSPPTAVNPYTVERDRELRIAWQAGYDEATTVPTDQTPCANINPVAPPIPTPAPTWTGVIPDQLTFVQGDPWTLDLNDYSVAEGGTFSIPVGNLPTGITLNPNGTFAGTVTNIGGGGTSQFEIINGTGTSGLSNTMSWSW